MDNFSTWHSQCVAKCSPPEVARLSSRSELDCYRNENLEIHSSRSSLDESIISFLTGYFFFDGNVSRHDRTRNWLTSRLSFREENSRLPEHREHEIFLIFSFAITLFLSISLLQLSYSFVFTLCLPSYLFSYYRKSNRSKNICSFDGKSFED